MNLGLPAEAPQPVRANIPGAAHAGSIVVGIGVRYGHDHARANHHPIITVIASVLTAGGAMHAVAAGEVIDKGMVLTKGAGFMNLSLSQTLSCLAVD